jgi:predicted hotdog family 3-hydroxylacyl-ACP dehydratase
MGKIKCPVPVVDVVPHKGAMSLLRQVIAHDGNVTVCDIEIKPGALFFKEGRVEAWVGLEYMAQAVAAHAGMDALVHKKPIEVGFLLGTRHADFWTDSYSLGQTLHIEVRHVWGEGELFCFDCSIADASDGRRLAAAQLNVYRPKDIALILKGAAS